MHYILNTLLTIHGASILTQRWNYYVTFISMA